MPMSGPMSKSMSGKDAPISRFLLAGSSRRRDLVGSDMLANAADVARRAALRRLIASYHLSEKVHIVITFTRHLFADRLQLFKKPGAFIHKTFGSGEAEARNFAPPPF